MKLLFLAATVLALFFSGGCALTPTKATVQVIEHKKEPEGHYSILFKVREPAELAGKYDSGSSWRKDLVKNADGGVYDINLNFTMVAILRGADRSFKPSSYTESPPKSKESDFLEMAKRIK